MVKIYISSHCPYCVALRKFLDEKGITFSQVEVTRDTKAFKEMVRKSGQMKVPVVDINGQIIVGFDREKISEVLRIKD